MKKIITVLLFLIIFTQIVFAAPAGNFLVIIQDQYNITTQCEQAIRGELSKNGFSMVRSPYNYSYYGDLSAIANHNLGEDYVIFVQIAKAEDRQNNSTFNSPVSTYNQRNREFIGIYFEVLKRNGNGYKIIFPSQPNNRNYFLVEKKFESNSTNWAGISQNNSSRNEISTMVYSIALTISNELANNLVIPIQSQNNSQKKSPDFSVEEPEMTFREKINALPKGTAQGTQALYFPNRYVKNGEKWVVIDKDNNEPVALLEATNEFWFNDVNKTYTFGCKVLKGQTPNEIFYGISQRFILRRLKDIK